MYNEYAPQPGVSYDDITVRQEDLVDPALLPIQQIIGHEETGQKIEQPGLGKRVLDLGHRVTNSVFGGAYERKADQARAYEQKESTALARGLRYIIYTSFDSSMKCSSMSVSHQESAMRQIMNGYDEMFSMMTDHGKKLVTVNMISESIRSGVRNLNRTTAHSLIDIGISVSEINMSSDSTVVDYNEGPSVGSNASSSMYALSIGNRAILSFPFTPDNNTVRMRDGIFIGMAYSDAFDPPGIVSELRSEYRLNMDDAIGCARSTSSTINLYEDGQQQMRRDFGSYLRAHKLDDSVINSDDMWLDILKATHPYPEAQP